MALVVNTNIASMDAYRNLQKSSAAMNDSLAKLSSGSRINKAADDAAGLAISTGLQSQINGMNQAVQNTQNGISIAQLADGALTETTSILQRMRTLAVQSSNGGSMNTGADAESNQEFSALQSELDRIQGSTNFNGSALLDGSYKGNFTVGADPNATGGQVSVDLSTAGITALGGTSGITGLNATGLGVASGTVDITSEANAKTAVTNLDKALTGVSNVRAYLGATQNRFQHTVNSLQVAVQNTSAANSQIADTDMASEMSNFTKNQILVQAGTSMLAQANQASQGILKLLG